MGWDLFISYARADNAGGWVTALRDAIYEDFRTFSAEPFRIFLDTDEIRSRHDWELRLREGLRTARVLLVCISPNYLRSKYCRWEWEEFARMQARRIGGGDAVTGVYFVELGGDEGYAEEVATWRQDILRIQVEQLQPWFPSGVAALQDAEVRRRLQALGQGVYEQLQQARLAQQAPGNLRRFNHSFVGRIGELRELRHQLAGGAVGVVTAVHGIGGMGKTELAVTYARSFAHEYQGGTWQVDADGHADLLEAVSTLALSPELGMTVTDAELKDRQLLGRRVLGRLAEITTDAQQSDPDTAACLLLLDNVSDHALLSTSQLSALPEEAWLHVIATTRLGISDVNTAGSRGSVAMIEIGSLPAADALALIREHQPARDEARLNHDFVDDDQEEAAREIVALLDGYTLAIEQVAVYLGTEGAATPRELLDSLRVHGALLLDQIGQSSRTSAEIQHQDKLTGVIVDRTLDRLPSRARAALAYASLLPPDTIPWGWLESLTDPGARLADPPGVPVLPGLDHDSDDWATVRRLLEGRRLLTAADKRSMARLHRVIGDHVRNQLVDPTIKQRLSRHLITISDDLQIRIVDSLRFRIPDSLRYVAAPDVGDIAVAASSITARLHDEDDSVAIAGLGLVIADGHDWLDLPTTYALASAANTSIERLAAADPTDTDYERYLQKSLGTVAEVLAAQGDTSTALTHYTRALHIAERLAAADPTNIERQGDLSISLKNVARLLDGQDDDSSALTHATRALDIAERLAAADPTNTERQVDLSISLNSVAGVLAKQGDHSTALMHATRALHIAERLAAAHPIDTERQGGNLLRFSLDSVGRLLASQGDTSGALTHYTRALHIAERLAARDPTSTGGQGDLSSSLDNVARLLARQGDHSTALNYYRRALHIAERLAAADPTNTEHQRSLEGRLKHFARLLDEQGDRSTALDYYRSALNIADRLVAADPTHTGGQRDLEYTLGIFAGMLSSNGETGAALTHYTRALHIAERVAAADPTHTENQGDLLTCLNVVAAMLAAEGDTSTALTHATRALHIAERLAAADPTHTQRQVDLSISLESVANMLADQGDTSTALDYYRRALHIAERLAAADPTHTERQSDVWVRAYLVATTLESLKNSTADEYWRKAHQVMTAMDAAGTLAASDRADFEVVKRKLGLQ